MDAATTGDGHVDAARKTDAEKGVREAILAMMDAKARDGHVWIVRDFARLGEPSAIYSALGRAVDAGDVERVGASEGPATKRGLYFRPRTNALSGRRTRPRPYEVVRAMARRDNLAVLVDKGVAANLVGVTPLQPTRQVYHTSRSMGAVDVGGIDVEFRMARPSKLFWADRPGMMAYQAMSWARDILVGDGEGADGVRRALARHVRENPDVAADLRDNVDRMPAWMREVVSATLSAAPAPSAEDAPLDDATVDDAHRPGSRP